MIHLNLVSEDFYLARLDKEKHRMEAILYEY